MSFLVKSILIGRFYQIRYRPLIGAKLKLLTIDHSRKRLRMPLVEIIYDHVGRSTTKFLGFPINIGFKGD